MHNCSHPFALENTLHTRFKNNIKLEDFLQKREKLLNIIINCFLKTEAVELLTCLWVTRSERKRGTSYMTSAPRTPQLTGRLRPTSPKSKVLMGEIFLNAVLALEALFECGSGGSCVRLIATTSAHPAGSAQTGTRCGLGRPSRHKQPKMPAQ